MERAEKSALSGRPARAFSARAPDLRAVLHRSYKRHDAPLQGSSALSPDPEKRRHLISSDEQHAPFYAFLLPEDQLLPPVCPRCLAPGVRNLPIPHEPLTWWATFEQLASPRPPSVELDAHYCEDCAERLEARKTRALSVLLAACVLGILTATALALLYGTSRLLLQLGVSLGLAALPPLLFSLQAKRSSSSAALLHAHEPRVLLAARRDYVELITSPLDRPPQRPQRLGRKRLLAAPLLITCAYGSILQHFGRSELWVIHSEQDLILLIDHTLIGTVPASLGETPEAGRREEVLGGRRTLSLVHPDGSVRTELPVTFVPGKSYLLGLPPPRHCLFLEKRAYGQAGSTLERTPLPGAGPLWEIPERIDFWFTEAPDASSGFTSGGLRTALRLLPCEVLQSR